METLLLWVCTAALTLIDVSQMLQTVISIILAFAILSLVRFINDIMDISSVITMAKKLGPRSKQQQWDIALKEKKKLDGFVIILFFVIIAVSSCLMGYFFVVSKRQDPSSVVSDLAIIVGLELLLFIIYLVCVILNINSTAVLGEPFEKILQKPVYVFQIASVILNETDAESRESLNFCLRLRNSRVVISKDPEQYTKDTQQAKEIYHKKKLQ